MSSFTRASFLFLGAAVFLLNPMACSTFDGFEYDETEMKAAVEGTWRVNLMANDGGSGTFEVRLEQSSQPFMASRLSLVKGAMACDNRTLVKSASACSPGTEMPIAGQVTGGDEAFRNEKVKGVFSVRSQKFYGGHLTLFVGSRQFFVDLTPDGVVKMISVGSGASQGTATMMRLAR